MIKTFSRSSSPVVDFGDLRLLSVIPAMSLTIKMAPVSHLFRLGVASFLARRNSSGPSSRLSVMMTSELQWDRADTFNVALFKLGEWGEHL
jgi:hypothetical protein